MFAVLAHAGDAGAELLAQELAHRAGATRVALVRGEELLLGSRLTHRLGEAGAVTEIELADGRRLDSGELAGLACRLTHAPVPHFDRGEEVERRYAALEAHALLLSWLAGLRCPVVNPVTSRGLPGACPELPELFTLAASCGLRGRGFRLDTRAEPQLRLEPLDGEPREVLVAGRRVLGALGAEEAVACAELARRLNCPVLGIGLGASAQGGEPVLCGVDPLPRLGGEGAAAVADLIAGAPA
ncbi:MAG TPA: hypothetical protein VF125_03025 [Solirubrobacterales bacterium]